MTYWKLQANRDGCYEDEARRVGLIAVLAGVTRQKTPNKQEGAHGKFTVKVYRVGRVLEKS